MQQAHGNCLTCGTTLKGIYCHQCGEKVLEEKDRSIKHLVGQFIDGISHIDGKILKTIRLLIFRPGALTLEYIEGRRKKYMKPVQLFIVMNLLYFLLTDINTFYTPLEKYGKNYGFADKLIENRLEKRDISFSEYAEKHNRKAKNLAKLLIIINIPLFAFFVYLLHFRSGKYFTDHITFSLHYYSFMMFVFLLILPYLMLLVFKLTGSDIIHIGDNMLRPPFIVLSTFYLSLALRRVYKQKWWLVIPKALLLTLSLSPVIIIYRMVLFLLTFYSS